MSWPKALLPLGKPKTILGYKRQLAPTAALKVSPLSLGAMSIGDAWPGFMSSADKAASFAMLDTYYEAGGNFIDTANNYQDELSEKFIGEWMKERNNRDNIVLVKLLIISL